MTFFAISSEKELSFQQPYGIRNWNCPQQNSDAYLKVWPRNVIPISCREILLEVFEFCAVSTKKLRKNKNCENSMFFSAVWGSRSQYYHRLSAHLYLFPLSHMQISTKIHQSKKKETPQQNSSKRFEEKERLSRFGPEVIPSFSVPSPIHRSRKIRTNHVGVSWVWADCVRPSFGALP